MAYDGLTSRANSTVLVPPEVIPEIMSAAKKSSAVLQTMRTVPVATNTTRFPVASALPYAFWLNPKDTGLAQTTNQEWKGVDITIEDCAAIMPVSRNVIQDIAAGTFNLTSEFRASLIEAIARLIDSTVLFGTNAPASFPDPIVTAAAAAGLSYTLGTAAKKDGGIGEDLNQTMGKLEGVGYSPTAWVADLSFKKYLRGARDETGQKLFDVNTSEIDGAPVGYVADGLWPSAKDTAIALALDARKFIVGIRQDIELSIHTEGVISNSEGVVTHNLMQGNIVALKIFMRLGWNVANPINWRQTTEALRYPACVINSPVAK